MSRTSHEASQHLVGDTSPRSAHSGCGPRIPKNEAIVEGRALGTSEGEDKPRETQPFARPEDVRAEDIEDLFRRRGKVYTLEEKEKAWSNAAEMVQTYSDETIKRWKEEIDSYLVFAGLFSAVLTTFNVQTYMLLNPAPPDPSIAILQQITYQLASFSIHPPFVNSTQQPGTVLAANSAIPVAVPRWAIWLNGLLFSGLILSLAAATIGISARQWSNEYTSGVSGTSRAAARLRQHRLNNLEKWGVGNIVAIIPVLLQLALACFLTGILVLLWNLHSKAVAAISSALVSFLGLFTIITTLLPLFKTSCSYLTPQARLLYSLWHPKYLLYRTRVAIFSWSCVPITVITATPDILLSCWTWLCTVLTSTLALSRYSSTTTSFHPIHEVLCALQLLVSPPDKWPGSWRTRKQSWQGRERANIHEYTSQLDTHILVQAYSATLHPDALSAATVCLVDGRADDVIAYFRQLRKSARKHFGAASDSGFAPLGLNSIRSALSQEEKAALSVYFEFGSWPSSMRATEVEWAMKVINALITKEIESGDQTLGFLTGIDLASRRRKLLRCASATGEVRFKVLLHAVTGIYNQVRLTETLRAADDAKADLTTHFRCINEYLTYADKALKLQLPSNDLEAVRAYTRDVLAQLTRTLLEWITGDRMQHTGTSTNAFAVWVVMGRLAEDVSEHVLHCIDDELVPDVLRVAHTLAKPYDYDDRFWGERIPHLGRALSERVIRLKNDSGEKASPQVTLAEDVDDVKATASPSGLFRTEESPFGSVTLPSGPGHDGPTVRATSSGDLPS